VLDHPGAAAALELRAAIDTDGVARDPTSLFGYEERDDTANIVRRE